MNSFWRGWICALATISLAQDAAGKEAWLEHLQDHWIPAQVSVPVAIVLLVGSLCIEAKELIRANRD